MSKYRKIVAWIVIILGIFSVVYTALYQPSFANFFGVSWSDIRYNIAPVYIFPALFGLLIFAVVVGIETLLRRKVLKKPSQQAMLRKVLPWILVLIVWLIGVGIILYYHSVRYREMIMEYGAMTYYVGNDISSAFNYLSFVPGIMLLIGGGSYLCWKFLRGEKSRKSHSSYGRFFWPSVVALLLLAATYTGYVYLYASCCVIVEPLLYMPSGAEATTSTTSPNQ